MDLERIDAESLVQTITDSLESAMHQPLVIQFKCIVSKALPSLGANWKQKFYQFQTDFQRVTYLLKAIESSTGKYKRGVDKLGLNTTREEILRGNGKSDEISKRYLTYGNLAIMESDRNAGLAASTKAVFYATSPKQLARALAQRSRILYQNELHGEAIGEGLKALKLPCSQFEIGNIHVTLGHCYFEKKMFPESKSHYIQALKILTRDNGQNYLDADAGLKRCISEEGKNESHQYEPKWKCLRSKAPDLKDIEREAAASITEAKMTDTLNAEEPKFLSAPSNTLRMKYAGSEGYGWTMQLTRNVNIGDILIVEKPWAMSLWKERTKYCYYCCKRCHNLVPCSNCPHVGFCSEECEKSSKEPLELPEDGNKHIYDCKGLCPAIIFDDDIESMHTAYNCLAKVPPNRLLDYICSTGSYASGRGHQAFKGSEEVRRAPPSVFDPSDYSSISFLTTCSDQRRDGTLEYFTKAAVFMTFCLYLEGYPMEWFDETDLFYSDPSSSNRPEIIPASWIAACLLYHIQAMDVNYFGINENFLNPSYSKELAAAVYPTISLINHSCNPNVAIKCTDKGVAFIHALRPIQAGSEIFLSYKPPFYFNSTQERRDLLQSQYYFDCECEACSNDWSRNTVNSPEKLICQSCQKVFIENMDGCPVCKSRGSMLILRHFREEVIPCLRRILLKATCSLEDLKYATTSADKALQFIQQPSSVYYLWKDLYTDILSSIYGNRTLEPWVEDGSSESSSV
ncbi:unnamed protein product [Rodentolepis nana]|uniref:SET domain-containing protein n=1 Tax=Rodentolepis nana TaxID=102285 RepID=A0A0R3TLK9_RODNA|nr:unnamed protein product [Rodentolepis nana]